jgi:hypothetical protein
VQCPYGHPSWTSEGGWDAHTAENYVTWSNDWAQIVIEFDVPATFEADEYSAYEAGADVAPVAIIPWMQVWSVVNGASDGGSAWFGSPSLTVTAPAPTGILIQGATRGTGSTDAGSFNVVLSQAPVEGNYLVLAYTSAGQAANPTIASITQTNVVWTLKASNTPTAYSDAEIWLGVVGADAGTTIAVTVENGGAGFNFEIADVCEWSTLTGFDKEASDEGDLTASGNSGTTDATTVDSELVVCAVGGFSGSAASDTTQTDPTNDFTLLDGVSIARGSDYQSLAYLYKIVDAAGAQNSGSTFAASAYWGGCIATFTIAPDPPTGGGVTVPIAAYHMLMSWRR